MTSHNLATLTDAEAVFSGGHHEQLLIDLIPVQPSGQQLGAAIVAPMLLSRIALLLEAIEIGVDLLDLLRL